jgi:hypothetical protein
MDHPSEHSAAQASSANRHEHNRRNEAEAVHARVDPIESRAGRLNVRLSSQAKRERKVHFTAWTRPPWIIDD